MVINIFFSTALPLDMDQIKAIFNNLKKEIIEEMHEAMKNILFT